VHVPVATRYVSPVRGKRICAAVLPLAALVPAALPCAAAADGFKVGTARVVTTPPLLGKAPEPDAFGVCGPQYDGARMFALEEPYTDQSGDKRFNYPEPYCDANANGRYDGIYTSGGVDALANRVHDDIDARAVALSEGSKTYVYVSVVALGLYENYTRGMRDDAIK